MMISEEPAANRELESQEPAVTSDVGLPLNGKAPAGVPVAAAVTMAAPRDPLPWIYWGFFAVVLLAGALVTGARGTPGVEVPSLNRPVPAYSVIHAEDVTTGTARSDTLVPDVIRQPGELIGRYSREPLAAGEPIYRSQVVPLPVSIALEGMRVVSIPASKVLGSIHGLGPGDVVSVAAVPLSDSTSAPGIVLADVLVLDVAPAQGDTIVVLAVSEGDWLEYLAETRNAGVVLSKRIK